MGGYPAGEPPVPSACSVQFSDGGIGPASLDVKVTPARAIRGRRVRLHIRVTVDVSGVVLPVPGASVRVGGRRLRTGRAGRVGTTTEFHRSGRRHVIATGIEFHPGAASVRVVP